MNDDNSNSKETIDEATSIADSSVADGSQALSYDGRDHLPQYVNPKVAVNEEKAVVRSFLFMIIVLLSAVTAMASVVSFYVRNSELDDFASQFDNYAYEVIELSKKNAANTLSSIEAFSDVISSYAHDADMTWPYVTVPDFGARGAALADLSSASRVILCPVVDAANRETFEKFAGKQAMGMIEESMKYEEINTTGVNMTYPSNIVHADVTGMMPKILIDESEGPYLPGLQIAPFTQRHFEWIFLYNYMSDWRISNAFYASIETHKPTIVFYKFREKLYSNIMMPVYDHVAKDKTNLDIVGAVQVKVDWLSYFQNLLPLEANGIDAVLESSCGDSVTYRINNMTASQTGVGDHHDPKYDHMKVSGDFAITDVDLEAVDLPEGACIPQLTLRIYPSDILKDSYITNNNTLYALIVVAIFVFTSLVFVIYDCSVRRRQNKVMDRVIQQDKIVSNLFPVHLKDRLYGLEIGGGIDAKRNTTASLGSDSTDIFNYDDAPLADLFLDATVIFADISGFTAWSSTREPSQVFKLLETIYGAFDRIAQTRGVFKIETVGDCYVAVTGLPEPRRDHALAMAKFARDCMEEMSRLTKKLEVSLGPDTCDLAMRMGLHSGQVTAGVLRGERSRFQLFGDTVNTTARMESAGKRNRIHVSGVTADLLFKERTSKKWISLRSEMVSLKGKGEMQTYWLETKAETNRREKKGAASYKGMEMDAINEINEYDYENSSSTYESESEDDMKDRSSLEEMSKIERLVEWNVEILAQLLQQIVAARVRPGTKTSLTKRKKQTVNFEQELETGTTVLEEFKEIIPLPKIEPKDLEKRRDPNSVELPSAALTQLREFITKIGGMYRNNAFHNFEHASHVTSSVRKLLSRIVRYDNDPVLSGKGSSGASTSSSQTGLVDLACHSYGITSDPLTQFSVIFSAVIHDADHPGVPNAQLVKEKVPLASRYKEKSVAEQNSVDLAWNLLMAPQYKDLRACIYCNADEMKRFRQLVVNTVMATDICDKELGMLRKMRWAKAFSDTPVDSSYDNNINRKATIVIEHLIQASDVSHTMQHWHIYRKWNERFFMECYGAYKAGRADSDPSLGWYKGEIGFFDFYVIPLAKKLESCGVFGVSSHEYLNYAMTNREEWVKKGEDIVKTYIENYSSETTLSPTI